MMAVVHDLAEAQGAIIQTELLRMLFPHTYSLLLLLTSAPPLRPSW